MKITSKEAAERAGVSTITAMKWANANLKGMGEGNHKTYEWTESDLRRFQNRNKKSGRPKGRIDKKIH